MKDQIAGKCNVALEPLARLQEWGHEPIVRSTLRAIWHLVPDPFLRAEPEETNKPDLDLKSIAPL